VTTPPPAVANGVLAIGGPGGTVYASQIPGPIAADNQPTIGELRPD
jgi:hypothetical protein